MIPIPKHKRLLILHEAPRRQPPGVAVAVGVSRKRVRSVAVELLEQFEQYHDVIAMCERILWPTRSAFPTFCYRHVQQEGRPC